MLDSSDEVSSEKVSVASSMCIKGEALISFFVPNCSFMTISYISEKDVSEVKATACLVVSI